MTGRSGRAVRLSYAVASIAGVSFFVMSVVLLAVWPSRVLEEQSRAMAPERVLGLTASELRGRAVYGSEGCAYCHTQQVRYLHADMMRFGAPTLAWETRLDYPHLWGTRRIGPDLARVGATRSDDWHYAHLFAPRSVVSSSPMPAYTWLFDASPDRPRQTARDLVAYLQSLGRAREIAGPEGEARASAGCNCPDDDMARMAFEGPLNANPARTRKGGQAPALAANGDEARGLELYAVHCASCHGPAGAGDGPGAAALRPQPASLADHEYSLARLSEALANGVDGTAMQAWRDVPSTDLAAIARAVRGFSRRQDAAIPANLEALGQRVYDANCVQCHGATGAGDGSAAAELSIAPTDFRRQRPTLGLSLRVIRSGIEGTRMASWAQRLSEAEMLAAAQHVRTFFVPDAPAGGAP